MSPEPQPDGRRSGPPILVVIAIAVAVIVLVLLHLTGAVGPATH